MAAGPTHEASVYNHNKCLIEVAQQRNGYVMIKKVLDWGLTLEKDKNTNKVMLVDRISPTYARDWCDTRYGSNRFTAMHAAAFEGHVSTVVLLLKQGWTWWAKDKDDQTVLDILRKEGLHREADIIEKKFQKPIDKRTVKILKRQQKEELRKEMYGDGVNTGMKNGSKLKPIKKLNYEDLARESESDGETPRCKTPEQQVDRERIIQGEVTRRIRAEMKAQIMNVDMSEVFSP
jgi:hypothetical protein